MSRRFSVPVSFVRQLLEQVAQQGIDTQQLLAEAGLDLATLERKQRLPAAQFGDLYQRVMYLAQDEFFGMLSGGKVPLGTFRMMCHAILHCATLEKAIYRASAFHDICRGVQVKPKLVRQGRYAHLSFAAVEVAEQPLQELLSKAAPVTIRNSLAMWHSFICWLVDYPVSLKAVYFSFDRPHDSEEYGVLFQASIHFAQHDNALVFPARFLDLPLVQTEASLRTFLKTAPYPLFARVAQDSSLQSRVTALLAKSQQGAIPSIEEVATRLHMSTSTLRRRLLQEQSSYQQIKDESRLRTAISYLNAPQLSLNDIAELMGFREPSAFFRSFKKWSGMTPSEYRQSDAYQKGTLVEPRLRR
ncbi:AraC family transcriptional regulator [Pontibacter sp. JAM-7]|uniref:AraC family transcriptional regulator n=1 Tax=Pontibacter sp. JAM-7 TaxID=3366581 RepID=UPI003AF63CD3